MLYKAQEKHYFSCYAMIAAKVVFFYGQSEEGVIMEQIGRKRRMRSRERKRIIRRRGIFVYRCICVGIVAAIMIVFVKFLPDIVSTVKEFI